MVLLTHHLEQINIYYICNDFHKMKVSKKLLKPILKFMIRLSGKCYVFLHISNARMETLPLISLS